LERLNATDGYPFSQRGQLSPILQSLSRQPSLRDKTNSYYIYQRYYHIHDCTYQIASFNKVTSRHHLGRQGVCECLKTKTVPVCLALGCSSGGYWVISKLDPMNLSTSTPSSSDTGVHEQHDSVYVTYGTFPRQDYVVLLPLASIILCTFALALPTTAINHLMIKSMRRYIKSYLSTSLIYTRKLDVNEESHGVL
jgi:hypothetical protein